MSDVRLVVEFDITGVLPRAVRSAFATALRKAITQGRTRGEIDQALAEELGRVVPDPERA